MLSNGDKLLPK